MAENIVLEADVLVAASINVREHNVNVNGVEERRLSSETKDKWGHVRKILYTCVLWIFLCPTSPKMGQKFAVLED